MFLLLLLVVGAAGAEECSWEFPRAVVGPTRERERASEAYLDVASTYEGASGDGDKGWLNLLAAHELNPRDTFIRDALVENYVRAGYPQLAAEITPEVSSTAAWRPPFEAAEKPVRRPDDVVVPFATVVGRWKIGATDAERRCLYDASVAAYLKIPGVDPTERNHAFFRAQMAALHHAGDYLEILRACPLWAKIHRRARAAAEDLLRRHDAPDPTKALRADCVLWASVHAQASSHEPHNTQDSLVGGVYYVHVPPKSGSLALFDPRGTSPGHRDTAGLPFPPFHATVELPPADDLLVLFPGWLVHSVLPAEDPLDSYRVSISVNFKGEWQDTAHNLLFV